MSALLLDVVGAAAGLLLVVLAHAVFESDYRRRWRARARLALNLEQRRNQELFDHLDGMCCIMWCAYCPRPWPTERSTATEESV